MSSRTIEVRRLRPGGAAIGVRTIQLLKASEGYPTPTPEYFKAFLSKAENVFVVAIDGEPVGYAVGYLLDRIDRGQRMMVFYEIGVAESRRREGVGRRQEEYVVDIRRREHDDPDSEHRKDGRVDHGRSYFEYRLGTTNMLSTAPKQASNP